MPRDMSPSYLVQNNLFGSLLRHTFCHLPGVGGTKEQRLWDAGVLTWQDLLVKAQTDRRAKRWESELMRSEECLNTADSGYFADNLPSAEQWRMFTDFYDSTAYVDIETTGLMEGVSRITTIALYDGQSVRTYVQGRNLEDFADDIRGYRLLVTFNGKCFDAPFLERLFPGQLPAAHVDLRFVLKSLGVRGGLKRCEIKFGLDRGDLYGLDGFAAVLLWEKFERTGDERYLTTLLSYNTADVLSLEVLMHQAFNMKLSNLPLPQSLAVEVPRMAENIFTPDYDAVEEVRRLMPVFF